jgi:acetate kinase
LRVLAVNAGSSSLKLRLLGPADEVLAAEDLAGDAGGSEERGLAEFLGGLPEIDAVGHRIVHGGERFREAVRIDASVESELRALTDLAPLHQPRSLAALDEVSAALPGVPAVACFDTAFHSTLPEAAATYALPAAWRQRYGLRRFGFHGLSHSWAARRAAAMLGREDARLVTCHLGAGASLAAVRDGRSVDTTMGFTALEGLVMATRSGSVDPGLLLWLLEREAASEEEMARALEHASGLLALAGTADMREVVAGAESGVEGMMLALDVYVHRLRGLIAAMAAAAGGIDALVFTGGVGENSPAVRAAAVEGLRFLGLELDAAANEFKAPDADVATSASTARVLVIAAREDLEIARQTRAVLSASGTPRPTG